MVDGRTTSTERGELKVPRNTALEKILSGVAGAGLSIAIPQIIESYRQQGVLEAALRGMQPDYTDTKPHEQALHLWRCACGVDYLDTPGGLGCPECGGGEPVAWVPFECAQGCSHAVEVKLRKRKKKTWV